MKLIIAIVRPELLASVQTALSRRGIDLTTVSEVLDVEMYLGREVGRPASKLRLEVTVDDRSLEAALGVIKHMVDLRKAGDGRVYVMELDASIPLRSLEPDVALGALSN